MARLLRRVVRHPLSKLLSLGVALFAWMWVRNTETHRTRARVDLQVMLSDDVVSLDLLPTAATITVEGPRVLTRRIEAELPLLTVDLRDQGPGIREVHLDAWPLEGVPSGLSVLSYYPDVLTLRLDERSRRKVAVEVTTVGEPAPDHEVTEVVVMPEVVEVEGPREVLDGLESVSSLPIDLSGLDTSRTLDVALDLPRGTTTTDPWEGEVEVTVESTRTDLTVSDVWVTVWRDASWQPVEGDERITVRLEGPTRVLRGMRLDRIMAVVELPSQTSDDVIEVRYGASKPPRYEVVHPRPDVVRVVEPPRPITVRRRGSD